MVNRPQREYLLIATSNARIPPRRDLASIRGVICALHRGLALESCDCTAPFLCFEHKSLATPALPPYHRAVFPPDATLRTPYL
jgi:hypothetical protein